MNPRAKTGRPYNAAIAAVQKWAAKVHASLFRATSGRVGGRMGSAPMLLLFTTRKVKNRK